MRPCITEGCQRPSMIKRRICCHCKNARQSESRARYEKSDKAKAKRARWWYRVKCRMAGVEPGVMP